MPFGTVFDASRSFNGHRGVKLQPIYTGSFCGTIAQGKTWKWEPNYTARVAASNKMHSASYSPVVGKGFTRPGWVVSQGVAYHPLLRPDSMHKDGDLPPVRAAATRSGYPAHSPMDLTAAAFARPRPNRAGFASSSLPFTLSARANAYSAESYN